jgi:hypothetical protein
VCGQPVYRLGWHMDLWDAGPNKNAVWHCACVVAWQFWNAPHGEAALLRRLQGRRCGQTGGGYGKALRLTTAFHFFRCGANIEICVGRRCSTFGGCQTFAVTPRCAACVLAVPHKNTNMEQTLSHCLEDDCQRGVCGTKRTSATRHVRLQGQSRHALNFWTILGTIHMRRREFIILLSAVATAARSGGADRISCLDP